MKKKLFIRADGNEIIGQGHIMRSMTIAKEFRKRGFDCIFISSKPVRREIFERNQFGVMEIDYPYDQKTETEAREISELLKRENAQFLIVDSYFINNEYLKILKDAVKLICINSTRELLCTDFLINENIACEKDRIIHQYSETGTKLLLGEAYSMIRDEFRDIPYKVKPLAKRVLISTGGSDYYNFMTDFLRRIKKEDFYNSFEFTFISGGYNTHYEELLKEAELQENVNVIRDAKEMAALMKDSDIAISGGGTTVLELSVIGVPTIGIALADDQKIGLSFMAQKGMIKFSGCITDNGIIDRVVEELRGLLYGTRQREELSLASRRYIDGNGVERIYDQIAGV